MRFDFDLNHEQFEALFTLMSRETKLKELFVSGNSGFISGGFTSKFFQKTVSTEIWKIRRYLLVWWEWYLYQWRVLKWRCWSQWNLRSTFQVKCNKIYFNLINRFSSVVSNSTSKGRVNIEQKLHNNNTNAELLSFSIILATPLIRAYTVWVPGLLYEMLVLVTLVLFKYHANNLFTVDFLGLFTSF